MFSLVVPFQGQAGLFGETDVTEGSLRHNAALAEENLAQKGLAEC